jgi:hypothetical protein
MPPTRAIYRDVRRLSAGKRQPNWHESFKHEDQMQANVIDKSQEQFHSPGVRVPTLLRWAIHILGMLLPILLVIYAFGASADAADRVQIIVSGCKTLMLMLVGTTALAVVYQLGVEVGSQVGRGNSTGLGQAVAARSEFGMGK